MGQASSKHHSVDSAQAIYRIRIEPDVNRLIWLTRLTEYNNSPDHYGRPFVSKFDSKKTYAQVGHVDLIKLIGVDRFDFYPIGSNR